MGCIFLFYL
uniref:Uncharacterized protein n=1 Tax=Arundo donax TaxID=35708 RepID=A0A0A9B0M4_ARUDO